MLDEVAHVVKTSLTRNVEVRFPDVYDEIIAAFSDHIPARSNGNHFLFCQDPLQ